MTSEYSKSGVDPHKRGIETFQKYITNIIPGAFCVVIPDPDMPGYGMIIHNDGDGSKPITSCLMYKEFGDSECFKHISQDVIAANLDDTDCVASKPIGFVDYVAVNPFHINKKEVLESLSQGFGDMFSHLRDLDIDIKFAGGETADLPDQLRTLDVNGTIVSRVKLDDAITGYDIGPKNYIVGARSGGRTSYEKEENSGIMNNGSALARHSLIDKIYEKKYPEIRDPEGSPYTGRFKLDDHLDEVDMTLFKALTSPSRIFSPVTKKILEKHKDGVTGIVHITGEGHTKAMKLGKNIHYIEHMPFEPDSIFKLIQKESREPWRNMFEELNVGTGMWYIAKDMNTADDIISIVESFGIGAKVIGNTEKSDGSNKMTIHSEYGKFNYV